MPREPALRSPLRAALRALGWVVPVTAVLGWAREASATPQEIELARALDKLGFEQAAVATMGAILDRPGNLTRAQALVWLGGKAATIPPAARLEARVARLRADEIARARSAANPASASGLAYLEGRAAYAAGRDEDAERALERVDRYSPLGPRASILRGAASVRLRRAVPAINAFRVAVANADAAPDGAYVRDLAYLSIARTFGAASVRLDENETPAVDVTKLSAAVKFYYFVDPSSDAWPDAAYELAATYYLAGDYVTAEGYARALASSTFGGAHALDAVLLRAIMQFSTCRYNLALAGAGLARDRATPVHAALAPLVAQTAASGRPDAFVVMAEAVRAGRLAAGPARAVVDRAFAERAMVEKWATSRASRARRRSCRARRRSSCGPPASACAARSRRSARGSPARRRARSAIGSPPRSPTSRRSSPTRPRSSSASRRRSETSSTRRSPRG